jgi:hypothetical protein
MWNLVKLNLWKTMISYSGYKDELSMTLIIGGMLNSNLHVSFQIERVNKCDEISLARRYFILIEFGCSQIKGNKEGD